MTTPVLVRHYPALPVDRAEIARYALSPGHEPPHLSEALAEAEGAVRNAVAYCVFPVRDEGDEIDLGFAKTASRDLRRALAGCDRVLLFAATVGAGMDRLVARYSLLSPAKAQLFQAIGAERVEALCDAFCRDMKADFPTLRPRYSPGYGDLPLAFQRDVFAALDPVKRLGLTLNESDLMTPTKSVTALAGIGGNE